MAPFQFDTLLIYFIFGTVFDGEVIFVLRRGKPSISINDVSNRKLGQYWKMQNISYDLCVQIWFGANVRKRKYIVFFIFVNIKLYET